MGSTLALLYIEPNKKEAVSANVGDSKIYIYRDGELKKISQDHNQAQSLVELGVITYEQALRHKSKSKLTQHLGIFPNELVIEPFISDAIMLKKGDIFLMCSDGLTDMLTEETIKELLSLKITLKKKAFKMVKEANKCGGNDNITVIIAMVK
jgi:protein phosphatase